MTSSQMSSILPNRKQIPLKIGTFFASKSQEVQNTCIRYASATKVFHKFNSLRQANVKCIIMKM